MYISRRVDIIGPPVWKSTISPCLSKSELASLRLWQSECQQCTLSPLHCHTLTPPRYPTMPSCTQNPSDVEHDTHRVICARAFTIHWCNFSLVGLRHRRGGWIMMVFTVQSNYRGQLVHTFHQLWL